MKNSSNKKTLIISIVISLLLHILLLIIFFTPILTNLHLIPKAEPDLIPEHDEYNRITYNLIETPDLEESEVNDPNRALASDKNLDASDENPETTANSDTPFNNGETDIKEYALQPVTLPQEQPKEQSSQHEGENVSKSGYLPESPEPVKEEDPVLHQLNQIREMKSNYENIRSSVADVGGMSFNTYKWDFAPYMLAMKKKIQENINPPPAFYAMGMIGGKNLIHFVVQPDGKLSEVVLIGSDAHISLDQTSLAAINTSAPFLPLPHDFPEEVLEINAEFQYTISRRK